MLDPSSIPPVEDQELLRRYIVSRSHLRQQDQSVKPDAFMPPPNLEMSVTRDLNLTDEELWKIGKSVSEARGKQLRGSADVLAKSYRTNDLKVDADPIQENSNHAIVTNWPTDKADQKAIAQQIAAEARFTSPPTNES